MIISYKDTISTFLKKAGLSYRDFNSTIRADNPTALIQGVKWSRPDSKNPTVSYSIQNSDR